MSSDSAGRHRSFASTLDLPFPLVSDDDSRVAKAFGVTRFAGWMPSRRATFVIDREGIVRKVVASELNVSEHAREALAALKSL